MQKKWVGKQFMVADKIFFATKFMKTGVLAVLIFITLFSCTQENLRDLLIKKINLFNRYGDKYFYGFDISPLRESENSVFRVVRFDTINEYAIIELKPHNRIYKNFFKDTIGLQFVYAFEQLQCTSLTYIDNHVKINFKFNREKYLLFRGYPQNDSLISRFDTTNSIQIDDKWKYVKL